MVSAVTITIPGFPAAAKTKSSFRCRAWRNDRVPMWVVIVYYIYIYYIYIYIYILYYNLYAPNTSYKWENMLFCNMSLKNHIYIYNILLPRKMFRILNVMTSFQSPPHRLMHCYPKPRQQEENEDQILDFIVFGSIFGVDRCFTHPNSWSIFKESKKNMWTWMWRWNVGWMFLLMNFY